MVDLLDESKTYYVKLRGSKLDYLMSLVSLHSVASPALDCRSGDRTSSPAATSSHSSLVTVVLEEKKIEICAWDKRS